MIGSFPRSRFKAFSPKPPVLKSGGFSGKIVDAIDRTQCYSEGQHVPCGEASKPAENRASERAEGKTPEDVGIGAGKPKEEATKSKTKFPKELPLEVTLDDEAIAKHALAQSFRVERGLPTKPEMTVADQIRAIDLYTEGKIKKLPLTFYPFQIINKLREKGIKVDKLSDYALLDTLEKNGFIANDQKDAKEADFRITAGQVMRQASPEEKAMLFPFFAGRLAQYDRDTDEHASYYYDVGDISHGGVDDKLSTPEWEAWADALEEVAEGNPLATREFDGKAVVDSESALTGARSHVWAYTKNYDVFLSGMASNWAITGDGTSSQLILCKTSKKIATQNQGKSFWQPPTESQRFIKEQAKHREQCSEERVAEHVKRLKSSTAEFYKQKLGKKKAATFDLKSKELSIQRGVGGDVSTYMPSPVESWTTDKNTAKKFGNLMAKTPPGARSRFGQKSGQVYTILTAKVTYDDILFSWETMKDVPGWPAEKNLKGKKEFVPFGGALRDVTAEVFYT